MVVLSILSSGSGGERSANNGWWVPGSVVTSPVDWVLESTINFVGGMLMSAPFTHIDCSGFCYKCALASSRECAKFSGCSALRACKSHFDNTSLHSLPLGEPLNVMARSLHKPRHTIAHSRPKKVQLSRKDRGCSCCGPAARPDTFRGCWRQRTWGLT